MHMMYLGIGMLASQFHNTRGMWFVAIFSPVEWGPASAVPPLNGSDFGAPLPPLSRARAARHGGGGIA